jgi:hypothetical protein
VQVRLWIGPVPHRDDDVALGALRAHRFCGRQFAGGDPVGPVREQLERARHVEAAHGIRHLHLRLPGHDAPRPRFFRLHVGEILRDRARRLVAELVAGVAAIGLDHIEPLRLASDVGRHAVALRPGARKLALVRHLQHRIPVDRRIIFRRCGGARRRHRGEVEDLAGRGRDLGRVDETVAAHPDIVIGLRQFRQHVAALNVGHHDLGEPGRKIGGLGDYPDAGLRPVRAADNTTEIAVTDADTRRRALLRVQLRRGIAQQHRAPDGGHGQIKTGLASHGALLAFVLVFVLACLGFDNHSACGGICDPAHELTRRAPPSASPYIHAQSNATRNGIDARPEQRLTRAAAADPSGGFQSHADVNIAAHAFAREPGTEHARAPFPNSVTPFLYCQSRMETAS